MRLGRGTKLKNGQGARACAASFTLALAAFPSPAHAADAIRSDRVDWQGDSATIAVQGDANGPRTYILRTTARLRDGVPASKERQVAERADQMILRTGHAYLDGLFALAMEEAASSQAPGNQLLDPGFNQGQGMPCECFESGEKWKYVWTRDTAYATELGLGLALPGLARQSLEFKLSAKQAPPPGLGAGPEIVQDTGSGGSWPVSTDRTVWAYGAGEVAHFLRGQERVRFRDRGYEALAQTLETDRQTIFDARDGLYRGEESFLDWREQSYPSWTRTHTIHIAMGKALSTNLVHYQALRQAAAWAGEKGLFDAARRYQDWADQLKDAINREFWIEDAGLYSSLKLTELAPVAARKFDLLGEALAVVLGVADADRARRIVESYPHSAAGAPVIWPQLPGVPVYHNRALWPFATAYWLRAARVARNDRAFDAAVATLVRGAALQLSNMENFEFLTQASLFDDGELSGPVVNSRRQLWSVGGFLSLVLKGLYGLEAGSDGIRFRPFITPGLRTGWFGGTDQLSLRGVPYLGKRLDVDLLLPPASAAPGCLEAARTRLNGADIGDAFFSAEDLGDGDNRLAIELRSGACGSSRITQVAVADPRSLTTAEYQRIFAPREPALDAVTSVGGRIRLDIRTSQDGVRFNIYRDGRLAAAGVRDLVWYDPDVSDPERVARCYAVEAVYPASGNTSHLSEPDCYWPAGSIHQFSVQDGSLAAPDGARIANQYGFLHFSDWGRPAQWLQTGVFSVARAGQYRVEVIYGNGFGPVTTGITATVKRVEAIDVDRGVTVAAGLVAMPQLGRWDLWGGSTFVPLALEAGPRYRLRISELFNMSYLEHFRSYTAAGIDFSAPVNRANVQMVKLLESPVAP